MKALFTTLTILALTFALAACDGGEPAPDAGNPDPVKTPPVDTDTPDVDDPTPVDTPDPDPVAGIGSTVMSAFEAIKSAVTNKNLTALYGLLSADSRKPIDDQIAAAREFIKSAEGQSPMAANLIKGQLGDKFGFSYDDLMNKPTPELGGMVIGKAFGDSTPGVFTGEVQGEPEVDGDTATVSVKKANGKVKDVEMVKEDDAWKLKYDL